MQWYETSGILTKRGKLCQVKNANEELLEGITQYYVASLLDDFSLQ